MRFDRLVGFLLSLVLCSSVFAQPTAVDLGAIKTDAINSAPAFRAMIGLGNVDNTSDANKQVSTATQDALNLKSNLIAPAFSGDARAVTASTGDNDTSIATTAFTQASLNRFNRKVVQWANNYTGLRNAITVNPGTLTTSWSGISSTITSSTLVPWDDPRISKITPLVPSVVGISAGSGYNIGDTLTLSGGTFTTAAQYRVKQINASGGVLAVSLITDGSYTVRPLTGFQATTTNGSGTGCTLNYGGWASGYQLVDGTRAISSTMVIEFNTNAPEFEFVHTASQSNGLLSIIVDGNLAWADGTAFMPSGQSRFYTKFKFGDVSPATYYFAAGAGFTVASQGTSGYAVGDILELGTGGTVAGSVAAVNGQNARFMVSSVTAGKVNAVTWMRGGRYATVPTGVCSTSIITGSGVGAVTINATAGAVPVGAETAEAVMHNVKIACSNGTAFQGIALNTTNYRIHASPVNPLTPKMLVIGDSQTNGTYNLHAFDSPWWQVGYWLRLDGNTEPSTQGGSGWNTTPAVSPCNITTGYSTGDKVDLVGGTGTAQRYTVTASAGVVTSLLADSSSNTYSAFPTGTNGVIDTATVPTFGTGSGLKVYYNGTATPWFTKTTQTIATSPDIILAIGSQNDGIQNQFLTDRVKGYLDTVTTALPDVTIVGIGSVTGTSTDKTKEGFTTANFYGTRVFWVDSDTSGGNSFINAATSSGTMTSDNAHLSNQGKYNWYRQAVTAAVPKILTPLRIIP